MKTLLTSALLFAALTSAAQTTSGKLSFALPEHPGHLTIDQGEWKITELSAKANGLEFGIRAEKPDQNFLGFLFVWPEKAPLTAITCRDEMLKAEGSASSIPASDRFTMTSKSDVLIALALIVSSKTAKPSIRAFAASGDLCADLSFSFASSDGITSSRPILDSLRFDALAQPTFHDAFAYATVAWDHHDLKGAILAYRSALPLTGESDDPLKWRRVTTDQLSMAYGMSGDLEDSRAVNNAAIAKDPSYPLYYYNLACADAEGGDAVAARAHLKQAFDRRANTLPGESLPDPASDDSILKLKNNKEFWAFVESLH